MQVQVKGYSDKQSLISFGRAQSPQFGSAITKALEAGAIVIIGATAEKAAKTVPKITEDGLWRLYYEAVKKSDSEEEAYQKWLKSVQNEVQ